MQILSAKEAREQVEIRSEYSDMDYLFSRIQERIEMGVRWFQIIPDSSCLVLSDPKEHMDKLQRLGYTVEYVQAVSEIFSRDEDVNRIESRRLLCCRDCGFLSGAPDDPLMCYRISW